LLDSRHHQSTAEVSRAIRDEIAAIDSLNRLIASGLAHRDGDFVFPTRAASVAQELFG
jgi:hypothetical protein